MASGCSIRIVKYTYMLIRLLLNERTVCGLLNVCYYYEWLYACNSHELVCA